MNYDASEIKRQAAGRWREILSDVAGIPPEILDGKNHPCPNCGGTDRSRFTDLNSDGSFFCNQCFKEKNGDGLAVVMWRLRCDFPTAVRLVGEWLGVNGSASISRPSNKQQIVAEYDYTDENGNLRKQACRTASKGFFQRVPKEGGGWSYSAKDVPDVPYRLMELVRANPADPVWIPEGEKDCDRLHALGCVATCNIGGAGKWRYEYTPHFKGRHVVVLIDNDAPGKRHGQQVATSLHDVAASVKVVLLPGLPEKGDVSDWLDAGHSLDELWELVLATPEWEPIPNEVSVIEDWPEIIPLDSPPQAPAFDPTFLPEVIRPWIEDIAERTQAPIDYPAVTAIVAMASTIGRQLTIRPKRCDDWSIVPNLWGLLIGVPSAMKTPSLQAALGPIRKLEVDAKREYAKAMAEWERLAVVRDEQVKHQQKELRKSLALGNSDLKELAAIKSVDGNMMPVRRRYQMNDSTTEKVGEILRDNPSGVLLIRDEAIGFLRGLDKSGHEQDRAFYLEAWNGNGRFTYDRIGRGTLDIEGLCVSIIGCTQPGPWGSYIRDAVNGGAGADGLVPRFQLAVWPESPRKWINVDRWPNSAAKTRAYEVFSQLSRLPTGVGKQDEFNDLPYLRFSPPAQELFDDWRCSLEGQLRSGSLTEVMEAHLAKFRSLIPSLALVSSLADGHYDAVGASYVDRAIRMGNYLEGHAQKLYAQSMTSKGARAVAALLARIKDGQLPPDGFTIRDTYRKKWSDLSCQGDVEAAVNVLVEHSYLVLQTVNTGGKPRNEYHVNPTFFS